MTGRTQKRRVRLSLSVTGVRQQSTSRAAGLGRFPSPCTWFTSHPARSWDRPRCAAPEHRALPDPPPSRPSSSRPRAAPGSRLARSPGQEFGKHQPGGCGRAAGRFLFPFEHSSEESAARCSSGRQVPAQPTSQARAPWGFQEGLPRARLWLSLF